MIEFVRISVGEGGPAGCGLCGSSPVAEYASADEVAARILAAAAPNVVLGGPEPFAHPELPALVDACVAAGALRVGLETDGAAMSVPANAAGVMRAGVRHIWLHIVDADTSIARTRDALAGVRAYLEAADAAGVKTAVTAIVPVCRHNLAALPATASVLAASGVHALRLEASEPLPESAGAVVAAACDTGMVNHLWVEADPVLPLPPGHALHHVSREVRDV
ncbi:MAG: hypothetical protein EG823_00980 [Actinobacteria bacterium]|nr:hypothetical protein [Actinomycetota bacterium]